MVEVWTFTVPTYCRAAQLLLLIQNTGCMLACLILAIFFQHRCTILLAEEGEMLSLLVAATVMILALVANLASTGKPILQRKQCCGPV